MNHINKTIQLIAGACHQNDRDRMREYLTSWMSLKAQKYDWFKQVRTANAAVEIVRNRIIGPPL